MTTLSKPWYDCLDYSAPIAASESAKGLGPKPTTDAMKLRRMNFVNRGYEDDQGRIDARSAIRLGETLDPDAPVVIDDEARLNQMFTVSPTPMPTHHEQRRLVRADLDELVFCLSASGPGRAAFWRGYGYYQSIIGASHPANGGTWWKDHAVANRAVFDNPTFNKPIVTPVVSAYVSYNDDNVERERLIRALAASDAVYNRPPWVFVGLRYPSGYEEPARRFDFVRPDHMTRALEIVYAHAAGIVLWTWNGYGPEGYRGRRDDNGYPTEIGGACGAGWDSNLPAWKAVEAFRAKIDAAAPKTATVTVGQTRPLFNRDERGRKV